LALNFVLEVDVRDDALVGEEMLAEIARDLAGRAGT
jgi:hypothetical protein